MKKQTTQTPGGIDLSGKAMTKDDMAKKVLEAKASKHAQNAMIRVLKRERDEVLAEFTAYRDARPVPVQPASEVREGKVDKVRVTCADMHGMRMDRSAVAAFLADVRRLDPDEVVLLGDMLDCEGWLAQHHVLGFVANCDYTFQEDIKATNWFLDELQESAPNAKMWYFLGNHEDRVERAIVDTVLGNQGDAAFLQSLWGISTVLRLNERNITVIRRDVIYADGFPRGWLQLGKMCFAHEAGGKGKNAAREVVTKAAANVTFGHSHREDTATVVFPGVGICKAFNPGCLCHMQPIYMHSDPSSWSQGYAIDYIAKSGEFQRVHVPIWKGRSLAGAMIERFKG
jgi:hypothetical protein